MTDQEYKLLERIYSCLDLPREVPYRKAALTQHAEDLQHGLENARIMLRQFSGGVKYFNVLRSRLKSCEAWRKRRIAEDWSVDGTTSRVRNDIEVRSRITITSTKEVVVDQMVVPSGTTCAEISTPRPDGEAFWTFWHDKTIRDLMLAGF